MRISFNWLRRYVAFTSTPEDAAQILTSAGLEVEKIEHLGKHLDRFVVGEVIAAEKHPNADKLTVCHVRVGKDAASTLQIVCGAPNVKKDQKVVVGLVGATVPRNQHDANGEPFVLTKVKLRGIESNGMICSEYELGIGDDAEGIMVLNNDAVVGTTFAQHLGLDDTAFEIGVTPNRPDCLNHIGVARELAAATGKQLLIPEEKNWTESKEKIAKHLAVDVVNAAACPRYSAAMISDVRIGPSPSWLQNLLKAVGIRPINNVVDVTNFVMFELGQPLHAFDYQRIAGKKIIVQNAAKGQHFTTLDGKEHTLSENMLMICDAEKAVAIAGVMGGLNSEISEKTTSIVLESAYFSPTSIRRTSKQLGLSTDASQRFERGIDPNGTVIGVRRAAALIAELAGGKILEGIVDIYPKEITAREIPLRISRTNKILGTELNNTNVRKYLSSIHIQVKEISSDTLTCTVPTFRPDILEEIDLIEEVARLHGYNNIEDKMVSAIDFKNMRVAMAPVADTARFWFEANGFHETISNSMIDATTAEIFSSHTVKILNPLSNEMSVMRPSLLPSMLQNIFFNQNHGTKDVRLFELGKVYEQISAGSINDLVPGFHEEERLGICISGKKHVRTWFNEDRMTDIFDIKGIVESLFLKILLDKIRFIYYDSSSSLTVQTIGIEINGTYSGYLGKVSSTLLQRFQIDNDVYVAEINLANIKERGRSFKQFTQLSKFPSVLRDLAFLVPKKIFVHDIETEIFKNGGSLLNQVTLFDVYEGKNLPENVKSVAFSLQFVPEEKTLTDSEIDATITRVAEAISLKFGAELRRM
jgi:phenylalanyl-tRNA synthetase beta chain